MLFCHSKYYVRVRVNVVVLGKITKNLDLMMALAAKDA